MYDCSGKEGVFIVVLECGYLSVCQRVDVSGLPTVRCEIIRGWDCDKVIRDLVHHDKATDSRCVADLCNSCVWKKKKSSLTEATCGCR